MTAEPAKTKLTPNPAFMSHISQHLFTAVLWVDDDLTITWLNAQAEQLLATSTGRLLGQSILALLAPEEVMASTSNDKDKSKRTIKSRFAQAKKNQQPFIDHDHLINTYVYRNLPLSIDYSVTPVIYEEEHCFIIEMWNKDRQSRISEEQRQQQQYSVARHMLRSVAHEIKNPLAGIRGAAQLLQRQFIKFNDASRTQGLDDTSLQKNAEKLRSYTDIIVSETDRLTHLVGQFLGSNQLPNWQMINIHEPLEHVLSLVVNQYPDVTVQRDYDLSLPELCADEDQLIQVF